MGAWARRERRAHRLKLETEWLRQWADTYLPSDSTITYSPELFRRSKFTLVHLMHALRECVVVASDKLEQPGARWVVLGEDCNGDLVELVLHVVSATMKVEIINVGRMNIEDGSNDAA